MKPTRKAVGDRAERLVAEWLVERGHTIVATNLRLGMLEIDIVARDGPVIVVVEVRARGARSYTTGFSSFSAAKRLRIRRAGERLWRHRYKNDPTVERLRFDAASVRLDGPVPTIEYVRAAF